VIGSSGEVKQTTKKPDADGADETRITPIGVVENSRLAILSLIRVTSAKSASGFVLTSPDHPMTRFPSRLDGHVADTSDDEVRWISIFQGQNADGMTLIVRTKYQVIAIAFHVLDGAGLIFANGIDVRFVAPIRLKQVVVAVD
jgi:hypothetical protein